MLSFTRILITVLVSLPTLTLLSALTISMKTFDFRPLGVKTSSKLELWERLVPILSAWPIGFITDGR